VKAYGGVPIYFARQASSSGSASFMNGIGNVYSGLLLKAGQSSPVHYASDLVFTFPTGDMSRGFSTGRPTVDWTNTFSHSFAGVTPYASIGAANTISDTSFFVRPFTSKGVVGHAEAGALINVAKRVGFGASGYAVRATGEQEIISKVVQEPAPTPATTTSTTSTTPTQQQTTPGGVLSTVSKGLGLGNGGGNSVSNAVPAVFQTQQTTLGPAQVANDRGFSTWVTLRPSASTDLQAGYSRSAAYHLDSFFFGIGFRIGHATSVIK
jgi:hypothetical protein